MRLPAALVLMLLASLLVGACTHDNSDSGRDQRSGLYGGVSGGLTSP